MPVQPASTASVHPVLVGVQAHRRGLDPQRHVLGDQADVAALGAQVQRDDHDPAVVAVVAEAGRQHRRVAVVELDVQRAAVLTDRHRRVQPAVRDPQVVEDAQRPAGRTSRAPGGCACPPAPRSRRAGAPRRSRRSAAARPGRRAGRRCRGRTYGEWSRVDSRGAHGAPPLEGGRAPAQRPGAGPSGRRTRQHQPGLPWTARAARHPLRTLGPPGDKFVSSTPIGTRRVPRRGTSRPSDPTRGQVVGASPAVGAVPPVGRPHRRSFHRCRPVPELGLAPAVGDGAAAAATSAHEQRDQQHRPLQRQVARATAARPAAGRPASPPSTARASGPPAGRGAIGQAARSSAATARGVSGSSSSRRKRSATGCSAGRSASQRESRSKPST